MRMQFLLIFMLCLSGWCLGDTPALTESRTRAMRARWQGLTDGGQVQVYLYDAAKKQIGALDFRLINGATDGKRIVDQGDLMGLGVECNWKTASLNRLAFRTLVKDFRADLRPGGMVRFRLKGDYALRQDRYVLDLAGAVPLTSGWDTGFPPVRRPQLGATKRSLPAEKAVAQMAPAEKAVHAFVASAAARDTGRVQSFFCPSTSNRFAPFRDGKATAAQWDNLARIVEGSRVMGCQEGPYGALVHLGVPRLKTFLLLLVGKEGGRWKILDHDGNLGLLLERAP